MHLQLLLFSLLSLFLFIPFSVLAQRPNTTSICDYYTTALLHINNASTQYLLMALLVNTALIGNYTAFNSEVSVMGILNAGTYNGEQIDLLPYFDGSLKSTNPGGDGKSLQGEAVNFLDDGGAEPLRANKASNGDVGSNQ
jgi:hypothetical protein